MTRSDRGLPEPYLMPFMEEVTTKNVLDFFAGWHGVIDERVARVVADSMNSVLRAARETEQLAADVWLIVEVAGAAESPDEAVEAITRTADEMMRDLSTNATPEALHRVARRLREAQRELAEADEIARLAARRRADEIADAVLLHWAPISTVAGNTGLDAHTVRNIVRAHQTRAAIRDQRT